MSLVNDFIKAYEPNGAACWCINYLQVKYGIGDICKEADREAILASMDRYKQNIEKAFDAVFNTDFDALQKEIEQRLQNCGDISEKEKYCFDVLRPFGVLNKFMTICKPTGELKSIERNITQLQKDRDQWQNKVCNTKEEEKEKQDNIKACCDMIARREADNERVRHNCELFFNKFQTFPLEEGDIEFMYRHFVRLFNHFAVVFDWALMRNGIDLLELQDKSGIYIKDSRYVGDFFELAGSMQIATMYVEAINGNGKRQQDPTQPQDGNEDVTHTATNNKPREPKQRGRKSKPFIDCVVGDEETKARTIERLQRLIKGNIGKTVALIIYTAIDMGLITKPTFPQVQNQFGDIGNDSGYNKYIKGNLFDKNEIEGIKRQLQ